ncbi:helix-turn-helix transcriptional regulator [Phytoactinopolyspora halotolerans]|uniref:Helix-turn-helix transcriptional regulator n=2 Tax=Phytoactinopolyspora halotolerans TaxID=1981512 RepID=A0A6L9SDR3_9ACTN|nr:helix-turn-helix transcriptional regulator [Phytoactinopolyspora halotolerans]
MNDMWPRWDETRDHLGNDPGRVTDARAELEAEIAAYRLAEIRKGQHRTQAELADEIGVSQRRVSEIESADISRAEVRTVSRYIEALGGTMRLVAEFPGRSVELR